MADKDGLKVAKDYHVDTEFANQGSFHVIILRDLQSILISHDDQSPFLS